MDVKKISQNIRKIRELKEMTREDVAEKLEMSLSGYSKIERGEVDLTLSKLDKIATIMNLSVYQIINFETMDAFNLANEKNDKFNENGYAHKYIQKLEEEIQTLKKIK